MGEVKKRGKRMRDYGYLKERRNEEVKKGFCSKIEKMF